ncbi:hypothetical protein [uncultured Paludibaculum sp.]|uniref:hypothetical protein n=1 Tax=uncultured Paludibaculum sp. TaxID=1765020 RepID=UPI002AAB5149|nr:hypothetical protein [uncultured Paludibaculum sp.]
MTTLINLLPALTLLAILLAAIYFIADFAMKVLRALAVISTSVEEIARTLKRRDGHP